MTKDIRAGKICPNVLAVNSKLPHLISRAGLDTPCPSCRTNPDQDGHPSHLIHALKFHYPVGLLRFLLSSAFPSSHLSGTGLGLCSTFEEVVLFCKAALFMWLNFIFCDGQMSWESSWCRFAIQDHEATPAWCWGAGEGQGRRNVASIYSLLIVCEELS